MKASTAIPLLRLTFAFAAITASPAPGATPQPPNPLVALQELDKRVTSVGERLARYAAEWCPQKQWRPGFAVHDLSQYGGNDRKAALAHGLGVGPVVLAVAAGSAAERAGLREGDVLLALDGKTVPERPAGEGASFDYVARILDRVEAAFSDGAAEVEYRRRGEPGRIRIIADPGCATRFQLMPSRVLNAWADGRYVQLTSAMVQYLGDDDALAAVMAHEFGHNVLRHRERRKGMPSKGRRAVMLAQEEEADRLSVNLVAGAGFDPEAVPRLIRRIARERPRFLVRRTHHPLERRLTAIEGELEKLSGAPRRTSLQRR